MSVSKRIQNKPMQRWNQFENLPVCFSYDFNETHLNRCILSIGNVNFQLAIMCYLLFFS